MSSFRESKRREVQKFDQEDSMTFSRVKEERQRQIEELSKL